MNLQLTVFPKIALYTGKNGTERKDDIIVYIDKPKGPKLLRNWQGIIAR